jgi:Flp pilus assembly protein TadG
MIKRRADSGKVTVFFALIAPSWIAILGLIIIGGGRVRAYQRADNIAAEAARAAGQAIDPGAAISGGAKVVDPASATAAAMDYLRAAGATGTVTISPGLREVTVKTTVIYTNPSGLGFIGGETWEANGAATATLLIG